MRATSWSRNQSEKGPAQASCVDDKLFECRSADAQGRPMPACSTSSTIGRRPRGTLKKAADAAAKEQAQEQATARPKLLPPVMYPSAIYCAGANYTDHMMRWEAAGAFRPRPDPHDVGLKPWHFIKASRTVTATRHREAARSVRRRSTGRPSSAPSRQEGQGCAARQSAELCRGATPSPMSFRRATSAAATSCRTPDALQMDWVGQKCSTTPARSDRGSFRASDIKDPQKLGIKLGSTM